MRDQVYHPPSNSSSATAPEALLKLKALPKLPPLPRDREWVFALQAALSPPLVRIGSSRHLRWSALAAQYNCPVPLKLIAAAEAPIGTERVLRASFRDFNQHGAWFYLHEQLRAFLDSLPEGGVISQALVRRWSAESSELIKPPTRRRPATHEEIEAADRTQSALWALRGAPFP